MDSDMERELTDDMCANAGCTGIGVNLWRKDDDSLRTKIKEMPWGEYFELVRPIHSMSDSGFKHYVMCGMKVDLLRALYYASMREPLIAVWPGWVLPAFAHMPVLKSDPEF